MRFQLFGMVALALLATTACKKKGCTDPNASNYSKSAHKDDGSCHYEPAYSIPSTYAFTDNSGHATVDYTDMEIRLEQFAQMMEYIESGETAVISAQNIQDMFQNTGGNGAGQFTGIAANPAIQLKDQCLSSDIALIESYFDSIALSSQSHAATASSGQAGTLTSGTSLYLFSSTGFDGAELIEKSIMGALLEYQALNVYLGDAQMNVDNTVAVDAANGKYYTLMEHHWDAAFGCLGVPVDFPTTLNPSFWSEYCNNQDINLSSNSVMMGNFLKGRAAISNKVMADRDTAIKNIREMWERIAAYQAMTYLDHAAGYFGNDQGKCLHNLTEAYGFIRSIRFAPQETRKMTTQEVDDALALFGGNLWNLNIQDIHAIQAVIDAKY